MTQSSRQQRATERHSCNTIKHVEWAGINVRLNNRHWLQRWSDWRNCTARLADNADNDWQTIKPGITALVIPEPHVTCTLSSPSTLCSSISFREELFNSSTLRSWRPSGLVRCGTEQEEAQSKSNILNKKHDLCGNHSIAPKVIIISVYNYNQTLLATHVNCGLWKL